MILLSILIPSLSARSDFLTDLTTRLLAQRSEIAADDIVEIVPDVDKREISIGRKRQRMLEKSKGEYVVFIDDEDEVSPLYVREVVAAIKKNKPDVIGFAGWMTTNGGGYEKFEISKNLEYTVRKEKNMVIYHRFNNHLSPIRRAIAIKIGYKDLPFAEDYDYALRLKGSGLIQTETYIDMPLYHYRYVKNK